MWNAVTRPGDYRAYFNRHAERVQWWQAVPCPCGSQPGQPSNINCSTCGGVGRFYPVGPINTRMVLTGVRQQQMLEAIGMLVPGDLVADQAPGSTPLSILDIVLTPWFEPFEGQEVIRGSGASDTLLYRAGNVAWCGTVSPTGGITATYTAGTDFTISGKTLSWVAGHGPAAGALYAIRYDAQFEWSPWMPGAVRMERGTNLGPRTALRKRHLVLQNLSALVVSG